MKTSTLRKNYCLFVVCMEELVALIFSKSFLRLYRKNNISVLKLAGISTDGAPSMLGTGTGFKGQVIRWLAENNIKGVTWCHCIIHQEALCAKTLGLENVMKLIVDVVNFIRSKGVNHREFKEVLNDLDSDYGDVIYFTSVRWLSRGAVLKRIWQLRDEISNFLASKGQKKPEFEDPSWISDFAFLVDMTTHLNILNSTLQGKNKLIHELYATIRSFETKLALFKLQLKNNHFFHFPSLIHKIMPMETNMLELSQISKKILSLDLEILDINNKASRFLHSLSVLIRSMLHRSFNLNSLTCSLA